MSRGGGAYVEGLSFALEDHVCLPSVTACAPTNDAPTQADDAQGGGGAACAVGERHGRESRESGMDGGYAGGLELLWLVMEALAG